MILWWVGNIVLIAVVVPVVVILLKGVLEAGQAIRKAFADIIPTAGAIVNDLNAIPQLLETKQHVNTVVGGLAVYGGVLAEIPAAGYGG